MIATFFIVALFFIESPLLAAELSVRLENPPPGGNVQFVLFDSANTFGDLRDPVKVVKQPMDGRERYRIQNIPPGEYQFGEVAEYNNVEITMSGVDYGNYTITVVVYVVGSGYPIPTTGVDYQGLQNITINSDTITVDTPFELDFVDSF